MNLERTWYNELRHEFEKPYMRQLMAFLEEERSKGKEIYPSKEQIFLAFELTPFSKVRTIILGQDPYHGENEAHGLCFSVKTPPPLPPSLRNIFQELESDLKVPAPETGNLSSWAKNGVLLLNTILTVEKDNPQSHRNKGWEILTDQVIKVLSQKKEHLVFILWGKSAQKKASLIDQKKHLVLTAPHPSPLSSYRGFFGSRPFSKANDFLRKHHQEEINWNLSLI